MSVTVAFARQETVRLVLAAQTSSTFGDVDTVFPPAGSMRVFESPTLESAQERATRDDSRPTRSTLERINRRKSNTYSNQTYLLAPGAAIPPDAGLLLASGMGQETIGGSSVTYNLADSLPPLAMQYWMGGEDPVTQAVLSYLYTGAVVNEIAFNLTADDIPTLTFSGPARQVVANTATAAVGTVDGSGTPVSQITVNAGEGITQEVGARIQIGASTDHRITAIVGDLISFTPDVTTNEGAAPNVIPYSTYDDSQIATAQATTGVSGQFTLNGNVICLKSFTWTLTNNFQAQTCALDAQDNTYRHGRRTVTGELVFQFDVEGSREGLMRARQESQAARSIAFVAILGQGNTGDPRITINMPQMDLDFGPTMDMGEQPSLTIPFTALSSGSTANDEMSIVFDSFP